jgi:hypothetical protein
MTSALSNVVSGFNSLVPEEKEFAYKVFRKQIIESRRKLLVKEVQEAEFEYKNKKIKSGSVYDFLKDLDND